MEVGVEAEASMCEIPDYWVRCLKPRRLYSPHRSLKQCLQRMITGLRTTAKSIMSIKQTFPPFQTSVLFARTCIPPDVAAFDASMTEAESILSSGSRGRAYSERSGVARHDTGRSRTVTILPHDSASNTHVEYAQHGVRPLQGIVEEKSDIDYQEPHVHRPRSPTITPLGVQNTGPRVYLEPAGDSVLQHSTGGSQAQVVHHDIGHGLHLHHRDKHHGRGMMPFQVTDAHGNKQHVQEVILNDSGVQEIPMPSHGNVIFIVEEGVTLDVKDPETGEYIPLEQYYANMAARRQPQQDQFVVVNGDASNVIVEDHNGNVLHRGSKVKDEFIHRPHSRSVSDRSHERRSHEEHFSARSGSLRSGSNHVRHEEGSVISE